MAQTLLEAWNAPAECAELSIDVEAMEVQNGKIDGPIMKNGEGVSFEWITPLPMPIDPAWDKQMIDIALMRKKLNQYRIRVTGLPEGRCRLLADGKQIAEVTHKQFERGLDLLDYPEFPTVLEAAKVMELVKERHDILYRNWRATIDDNRQPDPEAQEKADRLRSEIRERCKPRAVTIKILWSL